MTSAEMKARKLIEGRTIEQIVTEFEMTENMRTAESTIVRGWYMDEMEKRDSEAFWLWVDSDEVSPRKFFIK